MSSIENMTAAQTERSPSEPSTIMSNLSDSRPSGPPQRPSSQATLQKSPSIERQPTVTLDRMTSRGSRNQAPTTRQASRPQTGQSSIQAQQSDLQEQQKEKKAEERFYVDNDYYSLNPWYEKTPPKPLFGLGRPFPRTVRPGMLWGRKRERDEDLQEHDLGGKSHKSQASSTSRTVGEHISNRNAREARQGLPILQIPPRIDEHGEHHAPPDRFEAEMGGRKYIVTRVEEDDASDADYEHAVGRQDEFRKRQSEQDGHYALQSPTLMPDSMGDNFHGDRPPPEDTESVNSADTAETQAEKQEIRHREEQAVQDYYNKYRNSLARLRARYPEAAAEFLATTIYLFFGIAGACYSITYPAAEGDYITQSWAWGLAVTAGIYVGGGVSGSHMNPWISITFSIFRGFPWKMCLVYCCMQMLAGFAAGALAWGIYRDAIMHVDPDLTPSISGKAFYTIPQDYVSVATAFFNDYLSAALYTCVAFAIGDDSNTPPGSGLSPLIYGLMSFLLCTCFGYNGLGVSPARDLGPRFVAWWVGYGPETFSTGWWAYGPIAAGFLGVFTGALVYDVFIFVGGESPVNYNWPSPKDLRERVKAKKRQAKAKVGKWDVEKA